MKTLIYFLVLLTVVKSFSYAESIEFEFDENNLVFINNGQENHFSVPLFKNYKDKRSINVAFKESFGVTVIAFFKTKRNLKTSDKDTLDLISGLQAFSNIELVDVGYHEDSCKAYSEVETNSFREREPEPDSRIFVRLKDKCLKDLKKTYDPIISSKKSYFQNYLSIYMDKIDSIHSEYQNNVIKKNNKRIEFTDNVTYLDIDNKESKMSFTCPLMFPSTNSLEVYKDLFPIDGSVPSFDTLRSNSVLEVFKDQKADAIRSCNSKRSLI